MKTRKSIIIEVDEDRDGEVQVRWWEGDVDEYRQIINEYRIQEHTNVWGYRYASNEHVSVMLQEVRRGS